MQRSPVGNGEEVRSEGAVEIAPLGLFAIAGAFGPVGVAYGVLAAEHGLGWFEVAMLSALGFNAAGQFAWLQLAAGSTPAVMQFGLLLAISLRYVPMALNARLRPTQPKWLRLAGAHLLSDASFAVEHRTMSDARRLRIRAVVAVTWILGTVLGVVGSARLADAGWLLGGAASFAGSCLMVLLAIARVRQRGQRRGATPWSLLATAIACILLCGPRWFWLPSVAIGSLLVRRRWRNPEQT